jgi:hypothetical protein
VVKKCTKGVYHSGVNLFQDRSYQLRVIAETGDQFVDLAPYVASINRHGVVAFQAALSDGTTGVFTVDSKSGMSVSGAKTETKFCSHPDINSGGILCVYTTSENKRSSLAVGRPGQFKKIVETGSGFKLIATPKNGSLGVYAGPDPIKDRILGMGDPLFDSKVIDLALNPVSLPVSLNDAGNDAGQIAIRVKLENNKQLIVCAG